MTCPSAEQLSALLAGSSDETVTTHLDHCQTCQRELERLTADADSLGEELRRPVVRSGAAAELASMFNRLPGAATAVGAAGSSSANRSEDLPAIPEYAILELLGRGGQGVVFKARDLRMNRVVALKLLTAAGDDAATRARFRREVEALAKLQHPQIVQIYDVGETEGRPYFTMEFVPGGSLATALAGTPQPAGAAAALVQTLAAAINAAHESGVVHRDLKPANVLVSGGVVSGESSSQNTHHSPLTAYQLKITDFGLAKPFDAPELTASGMLVGTPAYMAPEQVRGDRAVVGPAADIYALGAILYQMLTGRPPFQGAELMDLLSQVAHAEPLPPRRLLPGLPRDLDTICLKCLEKDPARRYATAAALASDLQRFLKHEPIAARPVGALGRTWRWGKRNPALAAASGALVVSLVAGVVVATAFAVRNGRLAEQRRGTLDKLTIEEGKTKDALGRVTAEKQRAQDALDQVREALDATTDEVLENLFARQQQFGEREKAFLRKTLAQYQRLVAAAGNDTPEARFARANGLFRCAALRHKLGELSEAITACQEAVAIYRQLVADVPDNPQYVRRLGAALNSLAVVVKLSGKPADAIASCQEARDTFAKLVAGPDAPPEFLAELSAAHCNLANLYTLTGSFVAAETSYRAALAIDRGLVADHPQAADLRKRLAGSYQNFAWLLTFARRTAEAETALKAAMAIQQTLPQDADLRQQLALGYLNLANVYDATARPAAAATAFGKARGLQAALATEFPSAPDYRQQLSLTLMYLAGAQQRSGQLLHAIETAREAVDIRAKLAAAFGRDDFKNDLAQARNTLGIMLREAGRYPEAAENYVEALAAWKELAAGSPNDPELLNWVAGVMVNLAQVRMLEGKDAVGRQLLLDAVPYHAAALKLAPRHPDYLRFFRNNRDSFLQVMVRLGDHTGAAAAAEDLVRNAIDPGDWVIAASGLAGSVFLAERDKSLPAAKRTAAATEYADRAVSLLRQAVAKGLRDPAAISRNPRFDPIRDRADVQALLKGMAANSKP